MICTGNNKNKQIYITNGVSESNVDYIKECYKNSKLYITSKFSMPSTEYSISNKYGKLADTVCSTLESIKDSVSNGTFALMKSETQVRNFIVKAHYWLDFVFNDIAKSVDGEESNIIVLVDIDVLSKHEWLFLQILSKVEKLQIVIIAKNAGQLQADIYLNKEIKKELFDVDYNIDYTSKTNDNNVEKNKNTNWTLELLEYTIYEEREPIKLIMYGIGNYYETCDFYGKLNKTCMNNARYKLIQHRFSKPTMQEINEIPRIYNNSITVAEVIKTMCQFIRTKDANTDEHIKMAIGRYFNAKEFNGVSADIVYNKIAFIITLINRIVRHDYRYLVYYGKPEKNDKIALEILSSIKWLQIIVLCSDKSNMEVLKGFEVFEQDSSMEYFDMPMSDSRDNIKTHAAVAQQRVNETFYKGDIIGMYKPGMFRTCRTKRFNTTYDELKLWWNKELYLRPGFSVEGDVACIPTLFTVVAGKPCDMHPFEFVNTIGKFCCGKVVFCPTERSISVMKDTQRKVRVINGIINGVLNDLSYESFRSNINMSYEYITESLKTRTIYSNGKLYKDRIKSNGSYAYKFMMINKQNMILDAIEKIIDTNEIDYTSQGLSKDEFADLVLSTLLNLNVNLLQMIQWFEFYTYNPNIVVTLTTRDMLSLESMILLYFTSLVGFDVLIFVPTKFSSIDNYVTSAFQYDYHDIGLAYYGLQTDNISINEDELVPEEWDKKGSNKKGLFSRLFGL